MTTLHTHTPAALGRPTNLMHNTLACAPTLPTAPTWTIETVTPATLEEASAFVNTSRRILFPSLGYDNLLDSPTVLDDSCALVARDETHEIIAAIVYVPFNYRFPHLPWPIGTAPQPKGNIERTTGASTNGTSTPDSSSSFTTDTTANSSTSSLAITYPNLPTAQPQTTSTPSTTTSQATSTPSTAHSQDPDDLPKTVEVLRLFVLPQYRRHGLAATLFQSLKDHALASGVQCMYLHTHPFLPGAIRFWEKQAFDIIGVDEEDEVWRTHHMQMVLAPSLLRRVCEGGSREE